MHHVAGPFGMVLGLEAGLREFASHEGGILSGAGCGSGSPRMTQAPILQKQSKINWEQTSK